MASLIEGGRRQGHSDHFEKILAEKNKKGGVDDIKG
jgi:hypothetical protein